MLTIAKNSMKKLENIVDSRLFLPEESLQPHERSFLIQPEKPSGKARVGALFGDQSLASPKAVKPGEEPPLPALVLNEQSEKALKPDDALVPARTFGKRSQSMAPMKQASALLGQ